MAILIFNWYNKKCRSCAYHKRMLKLFT